MLNNKNECRIKNLSEKDIELLLQSDEAYKDYEDLIYEAEDKTYEFFNLENQEFTDEENLEYFEEKKRLAGIFMIEIDALEITFVKKIERLPFESEINEFVTCNKQIQLI